MAGGALKLKGLLQWCKKQAEGYPGVEVTNFTTSWKDGLAFCAIIHKYRPDLIDFNSLSKENVLENNALAFQTAEQELGIPALLDAEDMVAMRVPDKLCIVTYVSQYYTALRDKEPEGGPGVQKAVKRPGLASPTSPPETKRVNRTQNENVDDEKLPMPKKRGTLGDTCSHCSKKVYLLERHMLDGKLYHRQCYRQIQKTGQDSYGTKPLSPRSPTKRAVGVGENNDSPLRQHNDANTDNVVTRPKIPDSLLKKDEKNSPSWQRKKDSPMETDSMETKSPWQRKKMSPSNNKNSGAAAKAVTNGAISDTSPKKVSKFNVDLKKTNWKEGSPSTDRQWMKKADKNEKSGATSVWAKSYNDQGEPIVGKGVGKIGLKSSENISDTSSSSSSSLENKTKTENRKETKMEIDDSTSFGSVKSSDSESKLQITSKSRLLDEKKEGRTDTVPPSGHISQNDAATKAGLLKSLAGIRHVGGAGPKPAWSTPEQPKDGSPTGKPGSIDRIGKWDKSPSDKLTDENISSGNKARNLKKADTSADRKFLPSSTESLSSGSDTKVSPAQRKLFPGVTDTPSKVSPKARDKSPFSKGKSPLLTDRSKTKDKSPGLSKKTDSSSASSLSSLSTKSDSKSNESLSISSITNQRDRSASPVQRRHKSPQVISNTDVAKPKTAITVKTDAIQSKLKTDEAKTKIDSENMGSIETPVPAKRPSIGSKHDSKAPTVISNSAKLPDSMETEVVPPKPPRASTLDVKDDRPEWQKEAEKRQAARKGTYKDPEKPWLHKDEKSGQAQSTVISPVPSGDRKEKETASSVLPSSEKKRNKEAPSSVMPPGVQKETPKPQVVRPRELVEKETTPKVTPRRRKSKSHLPPSDDELYPDHLNPFEDGQDPSPKKEYHHTNPFGSVDTDDDLENPFSGDDLPVMTSTLRREDKKGEVKGETPQRKLAWLEQKTPDEEEVKEWEAQARKSGADSEKKRPAPRPPGPSPKHPSPMNSPPGRPPPFQRNSPDTSSASRKGRAPPPPSRPPPAVPVAKQRSKGQNLDIPKPQLGDSPQKRLRKVTPDRQFDFSRKSSIESDSSSQMSSDLDKSTGNLDSTDPDLGSRSESPVFRRSIKRMPAPPHPVPVYRRKIITEERISPDQIIRELDELDKKQSSIESDARVLEEKIRDAESNESSTEDELLMQWFVMVNDKNQLVRREAEIVYIGRQQELEETHAEIEHELRHLMSQQESLKTPRDRDREEALLQELLEIVNLRNNIVDNMDEDRLRYEEEDRVIGEMMALKFEGKGTSSDEKKKKRDKKKKRKKEKEKTGDFSCIA